VKKILFVTNYPNVGGGPNHILSILSNLDKKEFQLYLMAPKGWLSAAVADQKLPVKYYPLPEARFLLDRIRQARRVIIDIKTDRDPFAPLIVHSHSPKTAFLIGQSLYGLGAYFIHTEHMWTEDYRTSSRWRDQLQIIGLRSTFKRSSKVIAVSRAVERFLSKRKIVTKDKIEVIYPLIGEQKFRKINPRKKLVGPLAEELIIGSIGSLNQTKNYPILIEAVANLLDDLPRLKLEIIGDGPDRKKLEEEIGHKNLGRSIKILGYLPAEDVGEHFSCWRAYIQPSLSESFGLSVFEAMRGGLPVVASRVGGMVELVDHRESGMLFRSEDSKDLASKIKVLLFDQKLQQKVIKNALKKTADPAFDGRKNLELIENIYRQLGS